MKKVSVVIPCFNAGSFIQEALDSVFSQTYTNWEIIIVDDGSNDTITRNILQNIKHPQIQVHFKDNEGVSSARNFAIEKACGEIILPLDADDKIFPCYMEKAVPLFDTIENLGIVYCRAEMFGARKGECFSPPFSEEKMVEGNLIFCTAFFRKTDWEKANGFPEYARQGLEDYAFWLRILRLGRRVHKIDEILFAYRIQHESRTVLFERSMEDKAKTYALIFQDNIDFFSKHADSFYRFILYRENVIQEAKLTKVYTSVKPLLTCWIRLKFLWKAWKHRKEQERLSS